MKIAEIRNCVTFAQQTLGNALISTQIVGLREGAAIASYQSDGKREALVAQVTSFLVSVLEKTAFKHMGEYFFIETDTNQSCVFIQFEGYVWSIFFDTEQVTMGMMLNVHMPELINKFNLARE